MANNSSSSPCWQSDSFWKLGDNVNFAQYAIILPLYFTLGLFGHMICAAVFLKQAKNEKAYVYQIFLEITECLDNVVFSIFLLAFLGSGAEREGYVWYQKNYVLMWYAAHLSIPLYNSFSMSCLLLSVSMAADRAFALMKPFVYKNINHKRHQQVALSLSLILGFGTTFFNARLFEVQDGIGHYIIGVDIAFVGTLASTILSHTCNVTRMVGLLALILCNVSILHNFRKHLNSKTKLVTTQQPSVNDKKREAKEQATQRSLLLLTIAQSFFTAVTMFSFVIFYTAAYTVPLFNVCDHLLYAPLLNSVVMVCDLGKTCVIVAMNQKSRDLIVKIVCFPKNLKNGKITTMISSTNIESTVANRRATKSSLT